MKTIYNVKRWGQDRNSYRHFHIWYRIDRINRCFGKARQKKKKNYTSAFNKKEIRKKNNIKTYIKEVILIGANRGENISKYVIKRLNCISI